jgi:hypothetical protein
MTSENDKSTMALATPDHDQARPFEPIDAGFRGQSQAAPERMPSADKQSGSRARALATRLEEGARALATFASGLAEAEWQARLPGDGRKVGVVVHHVASVYPLEIQLAQTLARGEAVVGVTMDDVNAMNAAHASEFDAVTKQEALDLLQRNSNAAAEAIRALSDPELDNAAVASLYSDAPLTCQFMLEDHAVRHSYHHLARIRRALKR